MFRALNERSCGGMLLTIPALCSWKAVPRERWQCAIEKPVSSVTISSYRKFTCPVRNSPAISARRASAVGGEAALASTGDEDGKFVELQEDMEAYGPPVLLLLGISSEDREKIEKALVLGGADFIAVADVRESMLEGMTMWAAMHAADSARKGGTSYNSMGPLAKPPRLLRAGSVFEGQPSLAGSAAVCLMSGLTGAECIEMVDIVEEELPHLGAAGLAFAAMIPQSAHRPLKEVVLDILGDHADVQNGMP